LWLFFFSSTPVLAFTNSKLEFLPSSLEMTAKAGDELENIIRITNSADQAVKLKIGLRNLKTRENEIVLTPESSDYSLSGWVTVEAVEFDLPAKSSYLFKFNIRVPANALPGGYFGALTFAQEANEVGRVLLFLKIPGQSLPSLKLRRLTPVKRISQFGPINLVADFQNEGRVFVRPQGKLMIYNLLGRKVAEIEPELDNILPESSVSCYLIWEKKILWGGYKAVLSLADGQSAKTYFWVFPFKIIFLVLVYGLGFLTGLIWWKARRK